jgi:hypothetical protein
MIIKVDGVPVLQNLPVIGDFVSTFCITTCNPTAKSYKLIDANTG